MPKIKLQFLSTIYLLSLCVTLPLLCSSLSVRAEVRRMLPWSFGRRVLALRILAKHAAQDLGAIVLWVIAVPTVVVGGSFHSVSAALIGGAVGFILFTLLPAMMPMPSREMADAAATGRRFV
jgi:hypothetical protein